MRTLVLLLTLLIAACNARFVADFESDAVDSPPPTSPPGPPADEIVLSDTPVLGAGNIARITDNPGLVDPGQPHRFMSLIRDPDPGLSTTVFLRTSQLATSTQPVFLSWEQVLDGGGTGDLLVSGFPIPPPDERTTCSVFTGNDRLDAWCFVGGTGPDVEDDLDGFDAHRVHTVVMRIDRPSGPVVIYVLQDGQATPPVTLAHREMSWPAEGERVNVQIRFEGQSDGAYRFNSFRISERDPN